MQFRWDLCQKLLDSEKMAHLAVILLHQGVNGYPRIQIPLRAHGIEVLALNDVKVKPSLSGHGTGNPILDPKSLADSEQPLKTSLPPPLIRRNAFKNKV